MRRVRLDDSGCRSEIEVDHGSDADAPGGAAAVDGASVAALMPLIRQTVRRACASYGLRMSHVDDLGQDVFIRASSAVLTGSGPRAGNAKEWLRTVCWSVVIDRAREDQRRAGCERLFSATRLLGGASDATDRSRPVPSRLDPRLGIVQDEPERCAMSGETMSILSRAIAQLPTRQRDALLRSVMEGESLAAIAKRHGISLRTAERELKAALADLRRVLRWADITPDTNGEHL